MGVQGSDTFKKSEQQKRKARAERFAYFSRHPMVSSL